METWILVIVILTSGGPAMTTHEFSKRTQCVETGTALKVKIENPARNVWFDCILKEQ